ncbi:TMEM165/GDT1 family protein [Pseudaeromonas sharmana]|uniref:GDT1 family protein n=1 Tax=Pseudaeromonas sharmana TaxID=328412 RepID=A0ABV8CKT2_9GAMM
MEAFLVSSGIVALAEMGDKTQLLALVLAARFRKPVPIILGILIATLFNHAFAGAVGHAVTQLLGPDVLRWVLGLSFLLMAGWILIPDKIDDDDTRVASRYGVFGATLIAFFLAEMGDKTQVATVALAAHYANFISVVAGTTVGMLLANVPAVLVGNKIANRIPLKLVHGVAAGLFVILGLLTLFNVGNLLPQ